MRNKIFARKVCDCGKGAHAHLLSVRDEECAPLLLICIRDTVIKTDPSTLKFTLHNIFALHSLEYKERGADGYPEVPFANMSHADRSNRGRERRKKYQPDHSPRDTGLVGKM